MPVNEEFASDLIASTASGYGAAAARALLERNEQTAARYGPQAFRSWSAHLAERLRELAAAIVVDEPSLFAAEVAWARRGFDYRDVPLDDLRASLECLRETLSQELPESMTEAPTRFFEAAFARLDEPAPQREAGPADDPAEAKLVLEYIEAVLSGRRRRAMDLILSAAADGLDVERAYAGVLEPAQVLVGEMWHAQELSIAQEHLVTATTEALMTLLAHRADCGEPIEQTVIVALAPGNAHDLGARALAHRFEIAGWNAIYLGAELPVAEIAGAVDAFEADVVALSVAMAAQVRSAIGVVRAVKEARPAASVLVGGRVVAATPDLWRKLGADGSAASGSEALASAHRLIAS